MSEGKRPAGVDRSLSGNQSLFNIYYLGETRVDRRCNSSMMPWIIEELKLRSKEMKFIWLSPGRDEVSFVADNGQELFNHSYGNILQCCIAADGISFAYAARQEKDKYFCHVFQALTYEEAAKIMTEFKVHSQEEVTVPPTVSYNLSSSSPLNADGKSSGYIMSRSQNGSVPRQEEYKLEYWGKYEVPPPSSGNTDQVLVIDTLVAKYREATGIRLGKFRSKKKSFGSRFMHRNTKASASGDVEGVDSGVEASDSSHSLEASRDVRGRANEEKGDVPITFTAASPTGEEEVDGERGEDDTSQRGASTSPEDPADRHTGYNQTTADEDQLLPSDQPSIDLVDHHPALSVPTVLSRGRTESTGFDTLPELANLKGSSEFQALSLKKSSTGSVQPVRLLFSGVTVVVHSQQSQQVILKKTIQNIACCAQGKRESEFVAFTSRSKENKKYYCYLFAAKNPKMAVKVLESFKSAFVHALSLTMPPAVCEYCPYNQIQQLCKSLEGVSTQVAQSKVQECLLKLGESDYSQLMARYKSSEHADHEYTQIIVLVALLRQHFQKKQEKHTHRGLLPPTRAKRKPLVSNQHEDSASRLNVPALTRAKLAITNSFENLRSKPVTEKKQKNKSSGQPADSQNLSASSPLFTRKTSISTLMSPVNTSVKDEEEFGLGRPRSWTAGVGELWQRQGGEPAISTLNKAADEKKNELEQKNKTKSEVKHNTEKGVVETPRRNIAQRKRNFHGSDEVRHLRQSLTPPSSTKPLHKGHRRSMSNVISSSWRQEIFDSVSTPTKLDGAFSRPFSKTESEILEEWQVIEIGTTGETWREVEGSPYSRARSRWRNAIKQQILLNQMERENQLLKKEGRNKLKMHAFGPESSECLTVWGKQLEGEEHCPEDIRAAVLSGVPPSRREEVWQYLSDCYQARSKPDWQYPEELQGEETFNELRKQSTEYEHSIEVDLSRTFPSHPYFSSNLLDAGQAELQRILHCYAVADPETGYCQGLSFVTGIILMHTKDEYSAFKMLYQLMNLHDYKDIYKGSLSNLQTRLYQLSRLMHDFIPAVHHLLQQYEVTPFFYAAPWFLTIFASQYPISFTARVFDLLFYEGTDILFKVALSLLKVHESALLQFNSMETICYYLKTKLPETVSAHEDTIFQQALEFDFGGKLELFETEYQVLEELNARFSVNLPVVQDMESVVAVLRRSNLALVEQLAICHGSIATLQQQVDEMKQEILVQQERISQLECRSPPVPHD